MGEGGQMKLWKRRATEFAHDEFTGWACCYGVDDYLLSDGAAIFRIPATDRFWLKMELKTQFTRPAVDDEFAVSVDGNRPGLTARKLRDLFDGVDSDEPEPMTLTDIFTRQWGNYWPNRRVFWPRLLVGENGGSCWVQQDYLDLAGVIDETGWTFSLRTDNAITMTNPDGVQVAIAMRMIVADDVLETLSRFELVTA